MLIQQNGTYKRNSFFFLYYRTPSSIYSLFLLMLSLSIQITFSFSTFRDAKYYTTKTDTLNRTVNFISNSDTTETFILNYKIKSEFLKLNGIIEADSVTMIFKKVDVNSFPLINRGFHLVVESPENN